MSRAQLQSKREDIAEIRRKFADLDLIEIDKDNIAVSRSEWTKIYLSYRYLKLKEETISAARLSRRPYAALVIDKLSDLLTDRFNIPVVAHVRRQSETSSLDLELSKLISVLDSGDKQGLYRSPSFIPVLEGV